MPPDPHRVRGPLPALLLLLVGSLGIAAAWVLVAIASGRQASWVAVLAAIDAALLLRLGGMRRGWARAACGVLGTALAIAAANWGIVAGQVGRSMSVLPWDALFRIGPEFTWTLARLSNDAVDLAWCGAALVVAAVAAR